MTIQETGLLYPEEYIIEEDLAEMGDANIHSLVIEYIKNLLRYLYQLEQWIIVSDVNLYHKAIRNSQSYIVPDVMLLKVAMSADEQRKIKSWQAESQPPSIVFEVSSESTWSHDVEEADFDKPSIYGRIGVREYFSCDPHERQVWKNSGGVRLRGWRYDEQKQPIEIVPDEQGRLWSEELQSYLLVEGAELRMSDIFGNRRLTEYEAANVAREREEAGRLQAEAGRLQAEARAQAEAGARQQERQARQEAERQVAELKRQLEELRRQQNN